MPLGMKYQWALKKIIIIIIIGYVAYVVWSLWL